MSMEREQFVIPGQLYQHFKGKLYQIIGVASHSETLEQMVVYQALYGDFSMYVRPLTMFMSEVDCEKYPEITQRYRFELVDRSSLQSVSETPVVFKGEENMEETTNQDVHPERSLVNQDLLAFLDADDYAEKLEVLYSIRKRLNYRLMSDIEMSLDLPVGTTDIETRLSIVRDNLQTMAKFECRRLR